MNRKMLPERLKQVQACRPWQLPVVAKSNDALPPSTQTNAAPRRNKGTDERITDMDERLQANTVKQLGNGMTGFAVIFIPVMLHFNDPHTAGAIWTLAYIVLTLALAGVGLVARAMGDTLLSRLTDGTLPHRGGR